LIFKRLRVNSPPPAYLGAEGNYSGILDELLALDDVAMP
jgi:hypothetical protein